MRQVHILFPSEIAAIDRRFSKLIAYCVDHLIQRQFHKHDIVGE